MKTVIVRDVEGKVSLVVEGDNDPLTVAQHYIKVVEKLFPPEEEQKEEDNK